MRELGFTEQRIQVGALLFLTPFASVLQPQQELGSLTTCAQACMCLAMFSSEMVLCHSALTCCHPSHMCVPLVCIGYPGTGEAQDPGRQVEEVAAWATREGQAHPGSATSLTTSEVVRFHALPCPLQCAQSRDAPLQLSVHQC